MDPAAQLQWLVDIEQIKQLKAQYCAYCDEQYDPDGLAGLFASDGVWDGGAFGRAEGREAIREYFSGASQMVSFANHYAINPLIDINGDIASGKWDLWQPMVMTEGDAALWLVAKYKEQYVRTQGGWLFQSLELDIRALSPYESGFGKQRFIETS